MIKINIAEFVGYTMPDLLSFLEIQNATEFQIILNRILPVQDRDNESLALEYLAAAYAGHHLAVIASDIGYYVPIPYGEEPFYFTTTIVDMEKLAEVLYFIINGIIERNDQGLYLEYQRLAVISFDDVYAEKIECKTWGLLHAANEFMEKRQ